MLADGAAVAAGGHPGRPADTVAARVEEKVEGPAFWHVLRRQSAAVEAERAKAER